MPLVYYILYITRVLLSISIDRCRLVALIVSFKLSKCFLALLQLSALVGNVKRFVGTGPPLDVKLALEWRFGGLLAIKLALERRFGTELAIRLALERRFGTNWQSS